VTDLGTRPRHIGVRAPRIEDDRLLRGRGRYTADVHLPRMVEMAVVRSQFAHARFTLDLEAARAVDGVLAVVSAQGLGDVSPIPDFFPHAKPVREFVLQRDRARYVGAPLAAVVATDRYVAEDAAELVTVEYDELPVVATIEDALRPDAPTLFEDWPDDRVLDTTAVDDGTDEVFATAARVVSQRCTIQRHTAVPMEGRAVVASFEDGRLTVWTASQIPHILRTLITYVLPIAERDVRVIAGDVGGGFGSKAQVYPEEFLAAWLAMRLRRPVRFLEDRGEHLVSSSHARDQLIELEAATDEGGRILALRGRVVQDVGSGEIYPCGFNPVQVTTGALTQGYDIGHQRVDTIAVVTNKTPSGAYRGFGNPEAQFAMERLIEASARAARVHPVELRRSMLLRRDHRLRQPPRGFRARARRGHPSARRCASSTRRRCPEGRPRGVAVRRRDDAELFR
jgi:carbon-monoxide dehydrogenase large subunit